MRAISIMSGTSFDGIDLLLADIEKGEKNPRIQILSTKTYSYESNLKTKIVEAVHHEKSNSRLLCSLNTEIAEAYAACVLDFLNNNRLSTEEIDFIASHGQTIYHIPNPEEYETRSTLQLGDGSVLANLLQIPVVSNFRAADIAAGGQGAPLVPYAHFILFQEQTKNRVIQNIGGISNLTYLPKNNVKSQIIAFDNGPGNMMIDCAMKTLFDQDFDRDGLIAKKGKRIEALYNKVLQDSYFQMTPPKSTGRERFGNDVTDQLLQIYQTENPNDIISTLTDITVDGIVDSYQRFLPDFNSIDEVIVCGGGANNPTIIERLKKRLPSINVFTADEIGSTNDYLECLSFLILGYQTLLYEPNNVPSATGAKREVILGQISPIKRG